ncbi:ribulose-5-phosphate 4-epimerase/fuculose-1-phosphate aldolase [Erwinia persicina]|jgi:ribulose-5-phosphate 4-epimerase/fuculose-1-phosphate aldolase|uniref:3-oxo-tetronate 4-phosphate decarboxylase n=1 Tax=Erwinia plantamica TaxID=3237104 RepID=A0ABW7CK98_9GAMM|nr:MULTISPECIES: aldolase [Erwinia]MCP1436941.1 ribulose-5-phosphate 4-epimerase/fuculose-1-phosphate aldolase [Erwinia persicina]MDN8540306.1 aldolase [Erwinia sp. BC051422]
MTTEQQLREEICQAGRSLYERGYTVGTAGNISARLEDGWLITPTDACLGRLVPQQIAKVSREGEWLSGDKPSKTLLLHRQVYDRNPEVQGVVHTHSTNLVGLTLEGVWQPECILPPITPYQVMKVGRIPLIRYCRPGAPQVAEQVAQLACEVRGVMLERLGPVVWGRSVLSACFALEELEETARLWRQAAVKPQPLGDSDVAELCEVFAARW